MIAELKAYSDFKPTGLPWLERMPAHWNLVPNRALVRRRKQLVGRSHHRYTLLSLTKQGVIVRDVASGKGKFSSDMGTSQEVRNGDLVFCFFDVPETPRTVGLSSNYGMITGAYTVLEPLQPGVAPYFELFYRAMDDSKLLSPLYSGLRNTIPVDRFLGTKTPLPPPEEQAAIVRFLEHANCHVDRYIRAKRKQIGLLQEQKLVIVQKRVLGGVRARPALRPSGIDWVGDIPADWDVLPTRYLFRPVTRHDITGNEPKMSMSRHHGLVRSDVLHANRAAQAATAVAFSVCHPGDLVMNKYQAHSGLFGAAIERGLITANYSVFAPTKQAFTPYFALLYTSSAYRTIFRIASRGVGDGMMPLYTSAFHRVPSVMPPLAEQREIVDCVVRETAGVAATIAIIERQLQQIDEYRTRLVADVVTGQLDVRAAASSLPDLEPDTAPAEPSDDEEASIDDGEAA